MSDSALAAKLAFSAAAGHACGMDFIVAGHLKAHPEFNWQSEYLRDMKAYPWTTFSAGVK